MTPDPILAFFRGTGTDQAGVPARRHPCLSRPPAGGPAGLHPVALSTAQAQPLQPRCPGAPAGDRRGLPLGCRPAGDAAPGGSAAWRASMGSRSATFRMAPPSSTRPRTSRCAAASGSTFGSSGGNHNFLRLTRMLTGLRTLGCEANAESLFEVLDLVHRRNPSLIGANTHGFSRSGAAARSRQG